MFSLVGQTDDVCLGIKLNVQRAYCTVHSAHILNTKHYRIHMSHCTLCTSHCTLLMAHCTMLTVHCTLFHCTLYSCVLHHLYCTLYYYVLHTAPFVLHTVLFCTVHCTICTARCSLYWVAMHHCTMDTMDTMDTGRLDLDRKLGCTVTTHSLLLNCCNILHCTLLGVAWRRTKIN